MHTGGVSASTDMRDPGRTLTGWVALFGAAMATACTVCYLLAVDFKLDAIFIPSVALSLSPHKQALFRFSQLADCLGYYLPFVAIGAYLWSRLRTRQETIVDIAAPFILISSVLGVAGSAMQIAALSPLVTVHATGDASVQRAAEVTWLAVAHATENGLWVLEGPAFGFWAIVTGVALRRHNGSLGAFLALIGVAYTLYTAFAFVGVHMLAQSIELVILPGQVVWEAIFGVTLLQRLSPAF